MPDFWTRIRNAHRFRVVVTYLVLDGWKNADPNIRIVADSRRALGRLTEE